MIGFLRERLRARAIDDLGIAGMIAEPGLERFAEQAANAFAAPIALLNVIRGEQMLVKASAGIVLDCMPRRDGPCQYVLDRPDLLEICDAAADPLYRKLPAVTGGLRVRYYVGAPLKITDGTGIGALCVLDTRPREPATADQRAYLLGLARQAASALERHAHRRGRRAA